MNRLLLLALFASFSMVTFTMAAPAGRQSEECRVTATYLEGVSEARRTLIKLLAYELAEQSVLDTPETARLYLQMLQSTRRFYEEQEATLPACARTLNTALIAAITASQDTLALRLADTAATKPGRTIHTETARSTLENRWLTFSTAFDTTSLVAGD